MRVNQRGAFIVRARTAAGVEDKNRTLVIATPRDAAPDPLTDPIFVEVTGSPAAYTSPDP